jgi:heme o synthase
MHTKNHNTTNNNNWRQTCCQYLELCKIKVVLMMVVSAFCGMLLAYDNSFKWQTALLGLLGIGLSASSGGVINHILDQKIDKQMSRTKNRPLASGNLKKNHVIIFASILIATGMSILWNYTNPITTYFTLAAVVGYGFVYTGALKHLTPQNIVIGGINGALPPLLGWLSIHGSITAAPLTMVIIIFAWTPPHFWALAIAKYEDYKKSQVPMLPVTNGIPSTKLYILLYTIVMSLCTMLPVIIKMNSIIYLIGMTILNIKFLSMTIKLYNADNNDLAMPIFKFSITYLMLFFIITLLDRLIIMSL